MRANFDSIPNSFLDAGLDAGLDAFLGAFLGASLGASDLSRSIGSAATEAWAGLEVLRMVKKRHCGHRDPVRRDLIDDFNETLAAISKVKEDQRRY